jgi:hypothetical protein
MLTGSAADGVCRDSLMDELRTIERLPPAATALRGFAVDLRM